MKLLIILRPTLCRCDLLFIGTETLVITMVIWNFAIMTKKKKTRQCLKSGTGQNCHLDPKRTCALCHMPWVWRHPFDCCGALPSPSHSLKLVPPLIPGRELWLCPFRSVWRENSRFPPCLPLFLQHIINSVTACSKAPCLVVHIQSCRLKQTAICIPLGGKKQREAPFLIPPRHLAEYYEHEAPGPVFFLPFFFSPPPPPSLASRWACHRESKS